MADNTRWCNIGDTISTARPTDYGIQDWKHLHAIITTTEGCTEANKLIATGRWVVSDCGKCSKSIQDCCCI